MNKQIEKLSKELAVAQNSTCNLSICCEKCDYKHICHYVSVAKIVVSKGYRKQSEGEWKKVSDKYPRYACTACNHLFNNKEYKFCPNCGAKMKGR